jgi:purine-cytosine permease-like protein
MSVLPVAPFAVVAVCHYKHERSSGMVALLTKVYFTVTGVLTVALGMLTAVTVGSPSPAPVVMQTMGWFDELALLLQRPSGWIFT